jgi:DNA polymerase-3 subunit alpha
MSYIGEDYSLLPAEDMARNFADIPEAISNTVVIAERCQVSIELGKINLPHFEVPDGLTPEDYVKQLCHKGCIVRFGLPYDQLDASIQDRLDYELEIIAKTGFAAYFLMVADIVRGAHELGALTNTRGSAAGSIVGYLLNISAIDPLEYQLPFERFLTVHRPTPPDIDLDIADDDDAVVDDDEAAALDEVVGMMPLPKTAVPGAAVMP